MPALKLSNLSEKHRRKTTVFFADILYLIQKRQDYFLLVPSGTRSIIA